MKFIHVLYIIRLQLLKFGNILSVFLNSLPPLLNYIFLMKKPLWQKQTVYL